MDPQHTTPPHSPAGALPWAPGTSRLAAHKEVAEELAGWAPGVSGHEGKLAVGWAPGGIEDAPVGVRAIRSTWEAAGPRASIRPTVWPADTGQHVQPCGRHAPGRQPPGSALQPGCPPSSWMKNSVLPPGLLKPCFPRAPSSFTRT